MCLTLTTGTLLENFQKGCIGVFDTQSTPWLSPCLLISGLVRTIEG